MKTMTFEPKAIGQRLRKLRLEKALKQAEVAKAGGISTNTYSSWEQGNFCDIKVSHLFPVCQELNTTIENIITGHDDRILFEEQKLEQSIVMVLNIYKDFLSQMTADELFKKVLSAYYADSKESFIANMESVFRR